MEIEQRITQLSPLKQAIFKIEELQAKVDQMEGTRHEPIAIIGMGCRYPGGVDTPERFWLKLSDGFDAIIELPSDRAADLYQYDTTILQRDASTEQASATYRQRGGFLTQVDQFDAAFFGLSPREVLVMDPAHRLLLETTWQALEVANLVPADLFNTEMGVFIGIGTSGYINLCGAQSKDLHLATGNVGSTAAGRISYLLGLTGPCISVDTACSSSLVAIHLACQSLRNRECTAALAGGVNLILDQDSTLMFANGNMLSADARCKTFDASANGYVRSEGCGIIVLKRLSDALANQDNIVAVIRGTAINQDGPSGGLTVPNGPSQERVIRQALADAKLKPEQIAYIEAHGTGTPLGDPIEIGALSNVFKDRTTPLYVGSVKTNIGHLEMAAGVAGLMKLVLSLQQRQIPPHLHLHTPNPHIDWQSSPVQVPTALLSWPTVGNSGEQIGGVSSFGFSGTNAHVIVAAAPILEKARNPIERPAHLFTLSAKHESALRAYVQCYLDFLALHPDIDLGDLSYTSHIGRSHYAHRLSLTINSTRTLQQHLSAYANNEEAIGLSQGVISSHQTPSKIAYLFTGQGSQYTRMGGELYATNSTFRSTLDHCDALLRPLLGESIVAILYPDQEAGRQGDKKTRRQGEEQSKIDDTTYTQSALFVLEYALATLWQEWGVQAELLIGHSVGEVVAACVAGVFSLEDGIKLIAARSRLMGGLAQEGEMLSVMTDEAYVSKIIAPYPNEVSIAAINGPESIVISGKRERVLAIAEELAAAGIKSRKLTVSHAFHSPLMEPMLEDFRQVATSITYHKPKLRLVSNVTGRVAGDEISTPDYWVRHVRETVRFADGVQSLHEHGIGIFLEIGPKPVLLGMAEATQDKETRWQGDKVTRERDDSPSLSIQRNPAPSPCLYLPSLREGQSDWQQMLTSVGKLYVRGIRINWHEFDKDYHRRKVVLPTYPFQRKRYWVSAKVTHNPPAASTVSSVQVEPAHQNSVSSNRSNHVEGLENSMPTTVSSNHVNEKNSQVADLPLPTPAVNNSSDLATLLQWLQHLSQQNTSEINLQIDEIKGLQLRISPSHKEVPVPVSPLALTVPPPQPAETGQPSNTEPLLSPQATPEMATRMSLAQTAKRRLTPLTTSSPSTPITPTALTLSNQPALVMAKNAEPVNVSVPQTPSTETIVQTLKQLLADILYMESAELNERGKFTEQGVDSVTGVEFINKINRAFGLELKAVLIYDYSTIQDLAAYVAAALAQKVTLAASDDLSQTNQTKLTKNDHTLASQQQTQMRQILMQVANGEVASQEGSRLIQRLKGQE